MIIGNILTTLYVGIRITVFILLRCQSKDAFVHSTNPPSKDDFFWHIETVSQHASNFLYHLSKGIKLTKTQRNSSLTDEFIETIFKSRYFWMYSINPNSSEKQLFSVQMKCACYKLYIFNILIYTTWHEHKIQWFLLFSMPIYCYSSPKSRAHLEIALTPRLLQLFPCLGPQDQVTSVLM